MSFMNGAYVLVLKLNSRKRIKIGSLNLVEFDKGIYCYVGSALGSWSIEKRCERHLKRKKKSRWHIDYLRRKSDIVGIFAFPSKSKIECEIAKAILKSADSYIHKFGSSDCDCISHLFYFRNNESLSRISSIFSKGIRIY